MDFETKKSNMISFKKQDKQDTLIKKVISHFLNYNLHYKKSKKHKHQNLRKNNTFNYIKKSFFYFETIFKI